MTATVTSPAPPEPYLAAGPLSAAWHRFVAVGSGLAGLTASKALKHDLVTITDALVFVARITAQGKSHVHNQTSLWLPVMPATAAALTTIGLLITLGVAIVRARNCHEKATAAEYFNYDGGLRRLQWTRKGWH